MEGDRVEVPPALGSSPIVLFLTLWSVGIVGPDSTERCRFLVSARSVFSLGMECL